MNIIPNAFQIHNIYVDRAMAHLSESELRVLLYSIRHIMGWQEKINSRRGCISLEMYENGYASEGGFSYTGCGLKKAAIIKGINGCVQYGFLIRIGDPTQKGQEYELGKDIKWEELEKRSIGKVEQSHKRTLNATTIRVAKKAAAQVVTSDVPPSDVTSDVTMQGNVGRTPLVTSDVQNQSHVQSHLQNQEEKDSLPDGNLPLPLSENDIAKEKEKDEAASPPAAPEVEVKSSSDQTEPAAIPASAEKIPPVNGAAPTPAVPDAKPKKPRPADPEFDLIAKIWNTTAGGHISCVQGMIFGSKKVKGEWLRCQFDPPATLDELAAFEPYARQRMAEKHITEIPTAAVTIQRWFYDFRVSRQPKAPAIAAPFNLDDWELPQLAKMDGVA